jgi:Helix-turn-helix domain
MLEYGENGLKRKLPEKTHPKPLKLITGICSVPYGNYFRIAKVVMILKKALKNSSGLADMAKPQIRPLPPKSSNHQSLPESSFSPAQNPCTTAIYLAKTLPEENFDEDDRTAKAILFKKTALNQHKLSRCYRNLLGMILREYQVRLRIEKSKKHLKYPGFRIIELAYAIVYELCNNFSLEFKRRTGLSPREWKKNEPARSLVIFG